MSTEGSTFLHDRNNTMHASQDVEQVVAYLRAGGDLIPNEPSQKISAYIGFLADKDYVNDGVLTGNPASVDRQLEHHVIKEHEVPEAYFKLQQQIAREQGHGDIEITKTMRTQLIEAMQADQRTGLSSWIEYLSGDDAGYPDWFKHYAFSAVTKLGKYDKEKQEFLKRSRGTTTPYPELNQEALAYVYDVIDQFKINKEPLGDIPQAEELKKLLENANFAKMYAFAILHATPDSAELHKTIEGSWTKFDQTRRRNKARELSNSLQGHGTGWCTAGASTAQSQLSNGDFYVYYTKDSSGNDTIPRVAIRMENGKVMEVRGVLTGQELEPELYDITIERLRQLPGGEDYLIAAEDMKRVTRIAAFVDSNPDAQLSIEDLRFIFELDGPIKGFGYYEDPRINQITNKLDYFESVNRMLGNSNADEVILQMLADNQHWDIKKYLQGCESVNAAIAYALCENHEAYSVFDNFDKFEGLNIFELIKSIVNNDNLYLVLDEKVAKALTDSERDDIARMIIVRGEGQKLVRNLSYFGPLDAHFATELIDQGHALNVATHLDTFRGIDIQQYIEKMFATGNQAELIATAGKLGGIDKLALAQRFIESGFVDDLAYYIENFEPIDHAYVLQAALDTRQYAGVINNLEAFPMANQEALIDGVIALGSPGFLMQRIDFFNQVSPNYIAGKLLESGNYEVLAHHLDYLKEALDESMLYQLIDAGYQEEVVTNLGAFIIKDSKKLAQTLYDAGQAEGVLNDLYYFKGIDKKQLADQLIAENKIELVMEKMYTFQKANLDYNALARAVIETDSPYLVVQNLEYMSGLDASLAYELIDTGWQNAVATHLSSFKDVDLQRVYDMLMSTESYTTVLNALPFLGSVEVDEQFVIDKILESDYPAALSSNLKSLNRTDVNSVARRLIDLGYGASILYNNASGVEFLSPEIQEELKDYEADVDQMRYNDQLWG